MNQEDLQKGIITQSGITIDSTGHWLYRTEEIANLSILNYFKQNLYRIDKNYYIHNRFGEKNEFSILEKVCGFPLYITQIVSVRKDTFIVRLDYGEEIAVPSESFLYFNDTTVGIFLKQQNLPARLNGPAMASLMNDLNENEDGLITVGESRTVIRKEFLENYFQH